MSSSESDLWESVVAKLATQTQRGEVRWEITSARVDIHSPPIGQIYFASVEGKLIRVYEYSYDFYSGDGDDPVDAQEVAIEFVASDGKKLWEVPKTQSRWQLLKAVRYQASGLDDFLTKYLKAS